VTERKSANALIDDPDWCGHPTISRRTWACPDCERPVTAATRARMEAVSPVAPPGYVWVLISANQDGPEEGTADSAFYFEGVADDYRVFPRRQVREQWDTAAGVRERLAGIHWYQLAFRPTWFEGWDEEPSDSGGNFYYYELRLVEIGRLSKLEED
jgi:hypothetical protein